MVRRFSLFHMQIVHRSGNRHSNADGLSRIPDKLEPCDCYHAGAHLKSLPCGGCSYWSSACQQWERFSEDVDNLVPLVIKTPEPQGSLSFQGSNQKDVYTKQERQKQIKNGEEKWGYTCQKF